MSNAVRYSRGTGAENKRIALSEGLAMYNPGDKTRTNRPEGVFYQRIHLDRWPPSGERWAEDMVHKRYGFEPVVVDITVTPQNFPILDRRIHFAVKGQNADDMLFPPVQSFTELMLYRYPRHTDHDVTINLNGLPYEDLCELDINVGFRNDRGVFEYRKYQEWCEEYSVRVMTREEQRRSIEGGCPPYMRR